MTDRQQGIDALRGLAVLMVVFFHTHTVSFGVGLYDAFISLFREHGVLGVDLFFVLSGYCIHRGYAAYPERFEARHYLLRRFWRIYPPYFFALSLAVLLNLATNYMKWRSGGDISWYQFGPLPILSHLFMVHDLSQATMLTVSGPFWTVAMEMQYYLLYWVMQPLFRTTKGWVVLFVAALALYFVAWERYYTSNGVQLLNPFCYWIEWVLGAFLAHISVKRKGFTASKHTWIAGMAFLVLILLYGNQVVKDPQFSRLIIAAAFFVLVAWALMTEPVWRSRALAWLPRVGVFSYSVYLTHFLILDRVRVFVIPALPPGVLRMAVSLLSVGLSLYFAYLFYVYCEKPYHERSIRVKRYAAIG